MFVRHGRTSPVPKHWKPTLSSCLFRQDLRKITSQRVKQLSSWRFCDVLLCLPLFCPWTFIGIQDIHDTEISNDKLCENKKHKHKVKCLDLHSFWTFVQGQGTIYHYCILWTCVIDRPFPQHQLMMKLQRLLVSITEADFDLKRLPYDWTGGKHKDVWLYAEHTATN